MLANRQAAYGLHIQNNFNSMTSCSTGGHNFTLFCVRRLVTYKGSGTEQVEQSPHGCAHVRIQ